jgi:hypothetical protein
MDDKILHEVTIMKRARLTMNLGLKELSDELIEEIKPTAY